MPLRLTLLFGMLASAVAASDRIEFTAHLRASEEERFVLTDLSAGKASDWLKAGDTFNGYLIGAFDPRTDTLTLMGAQQTLTLALKPGKVSAVKVEPDASTELATRLDSAKVHLAQLRMRYRDGHPMVKKQLTEIAHIEQKLTQLKPQ